MKAFKPKKPQRVGSMALFGDVLPTLYRDLEMDKKVNEFAFLALWPQVVCAAVGMDIATQTQAIRLKKQGNRTILLAKVSCSALASELSFYTSTLQQALNAYAPQTGITIQRIQLSVGSVGAG
jgi:hypothetical protein